MKSSKYYSSKLLMVLMLSVAFIISGCASTGSSLFSPGSADSRLTEGEDVEYFSKSGIQACAAGAAVAVLACLATSSENKLTCSAIAGVAACGVAAGANYYLEVRRLEYKNTSERLDEITKEVKADTQRIINHTAVAKEVISDNKKEIANLKKQISAKQIDKDQAQQELDNIDQNIDILKSQLERMKDRSANYKVASQEERASGANAKKIAVLDAEINKMNNRIKTLNDSIDDLFKQRSSISLA